MNKIAIITARGGSKRIPRKNILPFLGKPIIAYTIEAAIKSGIFDEVMVSTDDDEIAQIAKDYGANVPFMRSEATANDFANTEDVLREVIAKYKELGKEFDAICCMYPTAPFITAEKLIDAFDKFENNDKADTLLPVVRFSYPPQRGLVEEDGILVFKMPEFMLSRSQDLQKMYHDVGQFYILRTEAFLRNESIMKGKIMPYELSELEIQDIDDMTDWKLAELKYQLMLNK